MQQYCVVVPWLLNNLVRRSLRLIDEIGVEDVELVALHNLWGRVVRAV